MEGKPGLQIPGLPPLRTECSRWGSPRDAARNLHVGGSDSLKWETAFSARRLLRVAGRIPSNHAATAVPQS